MKRKKKPGDRKSGNQETSTARPAFMKWQKGEYARHAGLRFTLPMQFLMLCRLMEVTPEQVLTDFMDNLGCGSWRREGREKARESVTEYFIAHGYGQHYYGEEDIRLIFRELDAIGMLWPVKGKMKLVDLHSRWRDEYYRYWYRKWFRKPRRLK